MLLSHTPVTQVSAQLAVVAPHVERAVAISCSHTVCTRASVAARPCPFRQAYVTRVRCLDISRDLFWNWRNATGRYADCIAQFAQQAAAAADSNETCAAAAPTCNGRGQCIDGECVCDEGTYGGQCDAVPSCQYWDTVRQSWSGAGCRLATLQGANGSTNPLVRTAPPSSSRRCCHARLGASGASRHACSHLTLPSHAPGLPRSGYVQRFRWRERQSRLRV